MNIYHFHPATGVYLGQGEADADPLNEGNWLLPAHSTILAPPSVGVGLFAKFDGTAWQTVVVSPAPPEPIPPTLAELKAAKNNEINQARLAANRSTFTHSGKVIACDELSRGDIDGTNGIVSLFGVLPTGWFGGWKAVDNTSVVISDVTGWKAFYASMYAAGIANFTKAQTLKAQLSAATTAAQVSAIAW